MNLRNATIESLADLARQLEAKLSLKESQLALAKEAFKKTIQTGAMALKHPGELENIIGAMQRTAGEALEKLK